MTKRNNPLFMVLPLLIFAGVALFLICRNLFWNRQLRSFLPGPDGAWLDICRSDSSPVGAGGDEYTPVEKIDDLESVSEDTE